MCKINLMGNIQITLFYSATLLAQVYSCIVSGAGKMKTALLAIKARFFTQMAFNMQTPPVSPLLAMPPEMLWEVMEKLEEEDALALIEAAPVVAKLYTPEQRAWLAFEKKCLTLINRNSLSEIEQTTLRQYYQEVLLRLLEAVNDKNLKSITALTEKFHRWLPRLEIEELFSQTLFALSTQQPSLNLQTQFEKLARVNFLLCITLCGIATLPRLKRYGVASYDFILARLTGNHAEAQAMLDRMGEPKKYRGNSVLHCAVEDGFLSLLPALFQANPECIDIPDEDDLTVLMRAAGWRSITTVLQLLQYKADVHWRNRDGKTALFMACEFGRKDTIDLLLTYGADIEQQDREGWTVLMHACWDNNVALVRHLLRHGAKIDSKNRAGEDVLAIARKGRRGEIVRLLENYRKHNGILDNA